MTPIRWDDAWKAHCDDVRAEIASAMNASDEVLSQRKVDLEQLRSAIRRHKEDRLALVMTACSVLAAIVVVAACLPSSESLAWIGEPVAMADFWAWEAIP